MRRRDRLYAWVRRRPLVPDALLALLLFPVFALPTFMVSVDRSVHIGLGALMCLSLVFRRRYPVSSFAAVSACGFVQWALHMPLTQVDFLLLLSLFSVSAYGPKWASRAGIGIGLLGVVLASTRYGAPADDQRLLVSLIGLSCLVIAAWTMGDVRRVRQMYIEGLIDRARQAERERDQRALIAAGQERARIAREIHDVVAHSLAVIVVQADGGRYAADQDPGAAANVLRTIGDTGRGALAEMRELLGVLRDGGVAADTAVALDTGMAQEGRSPQPDLGDLTALVDSVRNAGLAVTLTAVGAERVLSPGRSLAVYRVIQEALTNTVKHAGPEAKARVLLSYAADRLDAEVVDDGRGALTPADGRGHGMIGMRERLSVYGGAVEAGPNPGGGWRVALDMPYANTSGGKE